MLSERTRTVLEVTLNLVGMVVTAIVGIIGVMVAIIFDLAKKA